jgi:hypothetical protein
MCPAIGARTASAIVAFTYVAATDDPGALRLIERGSA